MLRKIKGRRRRGHQDEMAGWHHRCNEHELGQTLGDGEGQGGLVCCSPWGQKELDPTGRLNNNNLSTVKYKSPPVIKGIKISERI